MILEKKFTKVCFLIPQKMVSKTPADRGAFLTGVQWMSSSWSKTKLGANFRCLTIFVAHCIRTERTINHLTAPASKKANPPCIKKMMMPFTIKKKALELFMRTSNLSSPVSSASGSGSESFMVVSGLCNVSSISILF